VPRLAGFSLPDHLIMMTRTVVACPVHLTPPKSPAMAAAQQPQAGDEPVWVKDDDEDLEELVDLNLDKDAESAAHARQIDLQVAPGCSR